MSALRIPLRRSLTRWPQPCRGLSRVFPASAPNTVLGVGVRSMYKSAEVSASGEMHVVDLRSDTVTKPCAEMRRAMAEADVGDDVYGEDPTVNEIQHRAAEIFGTENALFVTSGTMGNLISVMCHCQSRGAEILIGDESHIYMYEQGSPAQIAGVFARPVRTLKDGCLDLQDLERKIQHDYPDPHHAKTQLICLENTHNRMGGRVLPLSYLREVRSLADHYHLKVHLDGARLLNAAQSLGVEPAEIVQFFDSVSVCLSKGLGAPVGALLGGRTQFVADARRARKLLGGGMRQAGVLAAAGIVALKRAKENVVLDHQNAKAFAKGVEELASPLCSTELSTVDSNMVMLKMNGKLTAQELCELLKEPDDKHGVCVQALSMSSQCVRLVWHRDILELDTKLALVKFTNVLQRYSEEQSRT
ncbi:L-allo-threonine aldolase-like [Rhinophrynus dorsalis]